MARVSDTSVQVSTFSSPFLGNQVSYFEAVKRSPDPGVEDTGASCLARRHSFQSSGNPALGQKGERAGQIKIKELLLFRVAASSFFGCQ